MGLQRLLSRERADVLFHAQTHIWNHIFSFINSMSLKAAVQLGIPDIIHSHGKPMTLSKLVAALAISPQKANCMHRLMRILVHSGFFEIEKVGDEEEGGYVLAPPTKLLLKDSSPNLSPFLLAVLDPVLVTPCHFISEWFHGSERTPFETAHGSNFWSFEKVTPEVNHFFNEAMASDSQLVMSVVTKDCRPAFEGFKSLVDVGGGNGTVARALVNSFPHLKCTVLDLPHVVADLQRDDKVTYVGGDMFKSIPSGDAILLKWILHDWTDEECVKILKRCKGSIPSKEKGGKVIIIDMVLGDHKGDNEAVETQLFLDMMMMIMLAGKERSKKEWVKIITEAGFSQYKITPVLGLRSLIEIYP